MARRIEDVKTTVRRDCSSRGAATNTPDGRDSGNANRAIVVNRPEDLPVDVVRISFAARLQNDRCSGQLFEPGQDVFDNPQCNNGVAMTVTLMQPPSVSPRPHYRRFG